LPTKVTTLAILNTVACFKVIGCAKVVTADALAWVEKTLILIRELLAKSKVRTCLALQNFALQLLGPNQTYHSVERALFVL